jgi:hypothetical protein
MHQLFSAARSLAFVAALSAAFPVPSHAQETSPPAPAAASPKSGTVTPSHGRRGHRENVEARIEDLHKRLGITAAQEPQWGGVAQAMRENAASIASLGKERRDKRGTMTAMDDLRSFEALAQAQADGAKKLTAAFEPLYNSMTDEQKKNADAVFGHRGRRHKRQHA